MTDNYKSGTEKMTDVENTCEPSPCSPPIGLNMKTNSTAPQVPIHINFSGTLDLTTIKNIVNIYHNSPVIHSLSHLEGVLNSHIKLNNIELELMDTMIQKYNNQYKSPLAKALNENENV
jgi:hypothetical protein